MFSFNEVVKTAEAVVSERPTYVYKKPDHMYGVAKCLYVHTDPYTDKKSPGCLVGTILHRLGIPLSLLQSYENKSAMIVATAAAGTLDERTVQFLTELQGHQDQGIPWGIALGGAKAWIGERDDMMRPRPNSDYPPFPEPDTYDAA